MKPTHLPQNEHIAREDERTPEPLETDADGLDEAHRTSEMTPHGGEIDEKVPAGQTHAKEEMNHLEEQVAALEEALLRSRADYDNYRKRVAREQADLVKHAEDRFLSALFPIMDNFELGFQSIGDGELPETVRGFRLIFDQLNRLFAERHVHSFGAAGEAFDPHRHDALSTVNDEAIEDGHIVQVVRRGYEREGRLLRAASVIVSKGKKID